MGFLWRNTPVSRAFPYPSGSPVKKPSEIDRERESISSALFVLKPPLNETPLQLPKWAPMERDARLQSLPLYILQEPQLRSIPSNFPSQSSYGHTPFLEASLLSLEVPRKRTSPSSHPTGPLWRKMPIFRAFFYTSLTTPQKRSHDKISPLSRSTRQRSHLLVLPMGHQPRERLRLQSQRVIH